MAQPCKEQTKFWKLEFVHSSYQALTPSNKDQLKHLSIPICLCVHWNYFKLFIQTCVWLSGMQSREESFCLDQPARTTIYPASYMLSPLNDGRTAVSCTIRWSPWSNRHRPTYYVLMKINRQLSGNVLAKWIFFFLLFRSVFSICITSLSLLCHYQALMSRLLFQGSSASTSMRTSMVKGYLVSSLNFFLWTLLSVFLFFPSWCLLFSSPHLLRESAKPEQLYKTIISKENSL